ncbi:MAG: ASCH domain-containing protein [Alphaproteobacteria bacterium]|nr:ASCH domain-containing protein [Alphaproteobacteria bacterium]
MPSEIQNIIKFWPESRSKILSGEKKQTTRWGERFFSLGQELDAFINTENQPFAKLKVNHIEKRTLVTMSVEDIQENGYASREDFWHGFQKSFPEALPTEEFTLVKFEIVK